MKIDYSEIIMWIVNNHEVIKATRYLSPKFIVRATRKMFGKRVDKRHNVEITLTIGRPNYMERDFIKYCKKAGMKFPIKKTQLKLYKPRKNKLK